MGIEDDGHGTRDAGDLLQRNDQAYVVAARAAVLLRQGQSQQPYFAHLMKNIPGKLVGLIDLAGLRRDLLFHKVPHHLARHQMFLAKLEIHSYSFCQLTIASQSAGGWTVSPWAENVRCPE